MSNSPEPRFVAPAMDATDLEKSQQDKLFVPYPNYTTVYQPPIAVEQPRRVSRGRRVLRVFLHFFLLVALALFFFPGLLRNISQLAHSIGHKLFHGKDTLLGGHYGTYEDMDDCVRFADWTVKEPGDYFVSNPEQTAHYPYVANTSVDLPVSSDLLYLLSSGALSNGVVEVTADGPSDSDVATVDVKLLYHHSEILEKAHVCLLQREEGKNGVGIFTPKHWHHHQRRDPHHSPFFAVKVSLPEPSGEEPLKINAFETNMSGFLHTLGDLDGVVDFETLVLRSANHPIFAKSVFAHVADVGTSNSPIYGNFTTSDSLILRSSNSPIVTNVTLINDGAADHATKLVMRSSNGHISSNLTLLSSTDDHTGGKFDVSVASSNSPIGIVYVDAPVDSVQKFLGHTSNSPARLTAHKTFEGKFFLRTSTWFPINVNHDDTVEDPAGKGRSRDVALKVVNRGVTEGTVRWVPEEDRELGSIHRPTVKVLCLFIFVHFPHRHLSSELSVSDSAVDNYHLLRPFSTAAIKLSLKASYLLAITPPMDWTNAEKSQWGRKFAPFLKFKTVVSTLQPQSPALILFFFPGIARNVFLWFFSSGLWADDDTGESIRDCVRFARWSVQPEVEFAHHSSATSQQGVDSVYPYVAITSLTLPISSELIYLLSRGVRSFGHLRVAADGPSDSDVATVEVRYTYWSPELIFFSHVCLLQREPGMNGVGIFTPLRGIPRRGYSQPEFLVNVHLPMRFENDLVKIKAFETDLPRYTHFVDDLNGVEFQTLKLRTTDFFIAAESVFMHAGEFETSDSRIHGNFVASDSLVLRTSRGNIVTNVDANATLINTATEHATALKIDSSFGGIMSNLTLLSSTDDHAGGKYKVTATAVNSSVALTCVDAPVDSVLELSARTSNRPVTLAMHKTFEGNLSLRTSAGFSININHDSTAEDPAGRGRTREVDLTMVGRGTIEGTVRCRYITTHIRSLRSNTAVNTLLRAQFMSFSSDAADPRGYALSVDTANTEKSPQGELPTSYTPSFASVLHLRSRGGRSGYRAFLLSVVLVALVVFWFPGSVQEAYSWIRSRRPRDVHSVEEDIRDCIYFTKWTVKGPGDYLVPNAKHTVQYPFAANTSVDLPISSDLLYLFTRGVDTTGVVQVTADGPSDSDVVTVEVEFFYHDPDVIYFAYVCPMKRKEGMNGAGIFTPLWPLPQEPEDVPFFSVKVHLPAPSDNEPLKVKGLEMDMPGFLQTIEDLEGVVDFGTLRLRASNHAIHVKSACVRIGDIETSNSPIHGNFSVSNSLSLRSANSPIATNITLVSGGHTNGGGYARISSNITLLSSTGDHMGGRFNVTVTSSNSPLDITYADAPVDSVLTFRGHTSNSPAQLTLHETFEGDVALHTTAWFPITADYDDTVEDPAGRDRSRKSTLGAVVRGNSYGKVRRWGSRGG
ncbi:hypothetical protein NM688_g7570 [Phlebia brevispora]|uniref:Uncharacterized protein n=1 Tax=Phlebia brevispora TaxID=194682 RepID=A0ACC1S3R5_9APHY|nr:hypothetical protein NM688_g7570 [Phlebia brevispora]